MDPLDVFLLAAVAAGAWTAWRQGSDLAKARASRGWPCAAGRVVRSEVTRESYAMGETEQVQVPSIEYVYTASGRDWYGRTVSFAPRLYTAFRGRAEDVCRRYFTGAEITVYYDPSDPSRSCLEPAESTLSPGWAIVGAALAVTIGAAATLLSRWT